MVRVWAVFEGYPNTIGPPWAELPLPDVIAVLDLKPDGFLSDLSETPKFGDAKQDRTFLGHKHVIAEVDDKEARGEWKPGFYLSPLLPSDAFRRLQAWPIESLKKRLEARLGSDWRVEVEEGEDAGGERALWAWLILKSEAPETAWQRDNRQRVEVTVREEVAESGFSDWVYVRFRKEAEERAAS